MKEALNLNVGDKVLVHKRGNYGKKEIITVFFAHPEYPYFIGIDSYGIRDGYFLVGPTYYIGKVIGDTVYKLNGDEVLLNDIMGDEVA